MQASLASMLKKDAEERMEFVKTSDGLTKVVFSSRSDKSGDVDTLPSIVRQASVIEQTHSTHPAEIPVATPATGRV